jgi:hypothetical protein
MFVNGVLCAQLLPLSLRCTAIVRAKAALPSWSDIRNPLSSALSGWVGRQASTTASNRNNVKEDGLYVDTFHQRPETMASAQPQPRFPTMAHIITRGTFYDVGFNCGLTFSEIIRIFYENCEQQMKEYYVTAEGKEFFETNLRVTQECFPQYVSELRGLADGAGIPFEHVFMANVFERQLIPDAVRYCEILVLH